MIKAKRSRRLFTGKTSNHHNHFELRGIIILLCTSLSSIKYTYLFIIFKLLSQYVKFTDCFTFFLSYLSIYLKDIMDFQMEQVLHIYESIVFFTTIPQLRNAVLYLLKCKNN